MSERVLPYALIRDKDNELMFEASYVKHYAEGFCAMFEQYPSSCTKVLLCKKLTFRDSSYGFNLMRLVRRDNADESTNIGYYTQLALTTSEENATKLIQCEVAAELAIRTILEGSE